MKNKDYTNVWIDYTIMFNVIIPHMYNSFIIMSWLISKQLHNFIEQTSRIQRWLQTDQNLM